MHCSLCGDKPAIENSHVIPKFIFTWLKETSPTGYLRTTENPRMRTQDGHKGAYLCRDCELRFSKLENHFSKHFFLQAIRDPTEKMPEPVLDDTSMKCVLSIMWRSTVHFLATHGSKENNVQPHDYVALDQARSNLMRALNGKLSFKINFMHLTPDNVRAHGLPDYYKNAYFYDRAVAEDVRFENSGATAWLKIPRVVFWIHTAKEIGNHMQGTVQQDPKDLEKLTAFVIQLTDLLNATRAAMPERQLQKIFDSLRPEKENGDWSASAKRELGGS